MNFQCKQADVAYCEYKWIEAAKKGEILYRKHDPNYGDMGIISYETDP